MTSRTPTPDSCENAPAAAEGCELRRPRGGLAGVFATRVFKPKALILAGAIEEVLDKPSARSRQVGEHIFVTHRGLVDNVGHSCDPNAGVRSNDDGGYDLIARRRIEPGEEITIDTAMCNYEIRPAFSPCHCGAATCRGRITGWKGLTPDQKQAYADFAAGYLFALDGKYGD